MLLNPSLAFSQDTKPAAPPQAPPATVTTTLASSPGSTIKGPVKYTPDGKPILEEGTPIRIRLTRTITSADSKAGDRVDFEVLDAVKVGETEIVPQGGIAWGTVTDAHAKKRMARGGKLNVNIDSVKLSNGDRAGLRAVKETQGGGHVGAMTGAMVATGIVFFPAAPLFLFMKGKDITIPKGTEITAYINADTPFTPPAGSAPVAAVATSTSTAQVEISSVPDGAEIEIDGAYSGSAPSTVTLAAGDHKIVAKKAGYQNWERQIHVSSGSVNVKAELQATSGQ
jgi:hypothetical protein